MTDPGLLPWLCAAITGRLELAREAADGDSGAWFMGDKWNVYRAEDEARYDEDYQGEENRLVTWGNIKPQSLHIAANDPRDVIARCEAELAMLEWFGEAEGKACVAFGDDSLVATLTGAHFRQVQRFLAAGYRNAAGYRKEWQT